MECGRCMITMRMRVSFVIVISNHPAHVRHYFERGEREREREGGRERARTRFVRKLRWHLRNSRGHCFLIKTLHPSASLSPPLSFSLSRSRSHSLSHSLTSLTHSHTLTLSTMWRKKHQKDAVRETQCALCYTLFAPPSPPTPPPTVPAVHACPTVTKVHRACAGPACLLLPPQPADTQHQRQPGAR